MSREHVALKPPGSRDLTGFPVTTITARTPLYRAHRRSYGPWFFASTGGGRFDLDDPRGTCYLALDRATAVREVLGTILHELGVVTTAFAHERVVSRLTLPADRDVADLCSERAADFGVTREIHTLVPYTTTRAWAAALDAVAGGVHYQSRFTTSGSPNAVGVFDQAGPGTWADDPAPLPFAVAAEQAGLTVAGPPRTVTIITP